MKGLRKIVLSILTVVMMLFVMTPFVAVKAEGEDENNPSLYVGGTLVTDENKHDILNDGGSAEFNSATGTLILNNPEFETGLDTVIHAKNFDLTITGNARVVGKTYGIFVEKGSLTFTGGTVYAEGNKAVYASKEVTVDGTELTVNASGSDSVGIYGGEGVTVLFGTINVTVNGSDDVAGINSNGVIAIHNGYVNVTSTSTNGSYSYSAYGMNADTIDIEGGTVIVEATCPDYNARAMYGDVTINGGETTVNATGFYSYGVSDSSFTLTKGKITITSKCSAGDGVNASGSGIDVFGTITVSGGELIASGEGGLGSSGIDGSEILISGGKVKATGKGEMAVGISCYYLFYPGGKKMLVTGGEVEATGSGKGTFGVFGNQPIQVTGGKLMAKGNNYGISTEFDITIGNGIDIVSCSGNEHSILSETDIVLGNELYIKEPSGGVIGKDPDTDYTIIKKSNGSDSTYAEIVNKYPYYVNIGQTENGTLTASRTKAAGGDTVYIDAVPAENCELSYIIVKGDDDMTVPVAATEDGRYEFTMPETNVTITVVFDRHYLITISEESKPFITVDPENPKAGDIVTITLIEDDDHVIKGITVVDAENNNIEVDDEDNTFEMPASPVTVTATVVNLYTISFDLDGGTLDGETGIVTMVLEENDIIVLGKPTKEGYEFQYWEGSQYYAGDEYQVTEDHKLTAVWKKNVPAPDTADNSSLGLYYGMLAVSCIGAASVLILIRKKRQYI
ncbi:MAG: InlB B-repeat-containing protein [Erysipelotrichaceae bacterium]|nr:InlB B-repeat-containing protein [Erysipelotrichaceae bacterium]